MREFVASSQSVGKSVVARRNTPPWTEVEPLNVHGEAMTMVPVPFFTIEPVFVMTVSGLTSVVPAPSKVTVLRFRLNASEPVCAKRMVVPASAVMTGGWVK